MFLFRARVSFISKVRGLSVLLSFISLLSNCQNQCVVHFQRAWGNWGLVVCVCPAVTGGTSRFSISESSG